MRKMKEKCMQIYEENKKIVYWYLKTKCTWLSDDEVHDVMMAVWKELTISIDEINKLETKRYKVSGANENFINLMKRVAK